MKSLLLGGTILAALAAAPANARLQLSISDGSTLFTCFDGELSCDASGGGNNLLTIATSLGGNFIQVTLAQSTFGAHNVLQLSSDNISSAFGGTLTFLASDTSFIGPVTSIQNAASLTFNSNVGATQSSLQFWADPANGQGANPTNTPGTLLETVFGTPLTDPDSFAGSNTAAFFSGGPFSMTEGARLNLIAGGSITGFNESMTTSSAVPEPSTWAMFGIGFALMGFMGFKRRTARFAL